MNYFPFLFSFLWPASFIAFHLKFSSMCENVLNVCLPVNGRNNVDSNVDIDSLDLIHSAHSANFVWIVCIIFDMKVLISRNSRHFISFVRFI